MIIISHTNEMEQPEVVARSNQVSTALFALANSTPNSNMNVSNNFFFFDSIFRFIGIWSLIEFSSR